LSSTGGGFLDLAPPVSRHSLPLDVALTVGVNDWRCGVSLLSLVKEIV
jgi:hypothetical protein